MSVTLGSSHRQFQPSPGARIVLRDAEWVVRRIDLSSDGGWQLTCDGVSEVVRGRTALFLTELEEEIRLLDPAETELVIDESPRFGSGLLHIESHLRSQVPNDHRIYLAHRAAMDPVPYQLDPALQALRQHRQRILIADAVGLGKTLEAGVLVSELIQRGRGHRILVVTLKSMLTQFQKEFWNRFTIPLIRLDSIGLARVRSRIPANHNPFHFYDRTIISIDTLKGDLEYRNYLENAWWDIIVIDECHNVADRGTSSQRARLAKLLARRSDTLIMLSATPHDGRARSFASLVNMLDPTAISDPEEYRAEDFRDKGLVVRRFKKDIQSQVGSAFKERLVRCERHAASLPEEQAYEALLAIPFTIGGRHDGGKRAALVRIGLQKALFSSPAAARESVAARIKVLQQAEETDDTLAEIAGLRDLDCALAAIQMADYAKYRRLLALLQSTDYAWNATASADRLVIFSERIETLRFLHEHLRENLRLRPDALALLHGGLADTEQQALVEAFGKTESPLRLLLCSDVAAEGLNLHYLSHRLIHFDMPWSLMVFQQRNGRIDRYGQTVTPVIAYLITESANPQIRGDMRILEVLQQKDEQAYKNIGDPSVFMNVYDVALEERLTEQAMADGMSPETFDATYQPKPDEGEDFLSLFLAAPEKTTDTSPAPNPLDQIAELPRLFTSDFDFCREALTALDRLQARCQWSADAAQRRLQLTVPEELRIRLRQLPRELWPEIGEFVLTDDARQIQREVERCRQDETAWPKLHYLWPQHVVMEWLVDRLRAAFGRHRAPVLRIPDFPADEVTFLIAGTIPNRKGQPLVVHWLAVGCRDGVCGTTEDLTDYLTRTGFGRKPHPNPARLFDLAPLQGQLPVAVAAARREVIRRRDAFDADLQTQLAQQRAELDRLRFRQFEQLELKLERSDQAEAFKTYRRGERTKEIRSIFEEYERWIEDTLTTVPDPYLQVIAAICGGSA